jgi:hypothetical protein
MSPQLVSILAQINASQARVLAMAATNAHWVLIGQSPAYDEQAFRVEADHLEALSNDARNCQ